MCVRVFVNIIYKGCTDEECVCVCVLCVYVRVCM